MAVINGTNGADKITGTSGNDKIYSYGGNDTIDAGDGNDLIVGGYGNDILRGGAGNDTIYDGAGDDRIFGGSGNDVIYAGKGKDYVDVGAGADTYYALGGTDIVVAGDDKMVDRFVFTQNSGSVPSDYGRVFGFEQGYDKFDLSAFDVRSIRYAGGELPEFNFTGADNQMIVWNSEGSNKAFIAIDTNGDKIADFELFLSVTQKTANLSADDFIL